LEVLQEEAPEEAREHPHGEEESRATGSPLRAIGRAAAARDHTVQMGMSDERLSPGVEHCKEPQFSPQMLGVSGDGSQRLGGRPKQEVVHGGFVLGRNGRHVLGHGEDDVEVLDVEQLTFAVVDPGRAFQRLTRGTMSIRARVEGDALVSARVTPLDMPTARGGAARFDSGHDPALSGRERRTGAVTIGVAVAADDVRHFQCRTTHGRASARRRRGRIR
jgi:hypothetical protein